MELTDNSGSLMPIHFALTNSHQEALILLDRYFQLASGGRTVLAFTTTETHIPPKIAALRNHWSSAHAAVLAKGIPLRSSDGFHKLKDFFRRKGRVGMYSSGRLVIDNKAFCGLMEPAGLGKVDSTR